MLGAGGGDVETVEEAKREDGRMMRIMREKGVDNFTAADSVSSGSCFPLLCVFLPSSLSGGLSLSSLDV